MKLYISKDEWYPVYSIDLENLWSIGKEVEAPDDLLQRYELALQQFRAVQQEMARLMGEDE